MRKAYGRQASPITRTDGFQLHIWLCILESIQDFNFRFDIQTTNVCTEIGPIKVSKSQKEIVVSPHTQKKLTKIFTFFCPTLYEVVKSKKYYISTLLYVVTVQVSYVQ